MFPYGSYMNLSSVSQPGLALDFKSPIYDDFMCLKPCALSFGISPLAAYDVVSRQYESIEQGVVLSIFGL